LHELPHAGLGGSEPEGETPIWCQPDVIEAMERAWSRTQNGASGNEAGFVLNGTPSSYSIVETKSANTKGYQKFTITTGGSNPTFLLFHVHPNSSSRNPSTPDDNSLDNNAGDTGIADKYKVLFLVGHRTGMTMCDPSTKKVTLICENLNWLKPCEKRGKSKRNSEKGGG
jgi:hypothetical protein